MKVTIKIEIISSCTSSFRFRHLDTKVHFKSKRENARKSPSPENLAIEEDKSDKSDKSPKFTPVQRRKFLAQQHPQSK